MQDGQLTREQATAQVTKLLDLERQEKALVESIKVEEKEREGKKAFFEINFATIIKIEGEIKDKNELEKILLCDVQIDITSHIEKSFLDILHNSGYKGFTFEKKLDFQKLYNSRSN